MRKRKKESKRYREIKEKKYGKIDCLVKIMKQNNLTV